MTSADAFTKVAPASPPVFARRMWGRVAGCALVALTGAVVSACQSSAASTALPDEPRGEDPQSAQAPASPPRDPTATDRVDAASVGQPWGRVKGSTMFRGNPTHTWYGQGPLPDNPVILWRFPRHRTMCAVSRVGKREKEWCGTGWTGQPVVYERDDGTTEIIFGAYDRRVHFLDAETGRRTRPDFATGDIIKGSVTLDPDGHPLIYFGSRDNRFRVVALDRRRPKKLWQIRAGDYRGIYDNDWDSSPVVVDGILYEGGENGLVFAVELNRGRDRRGRVTLAPKVLLAMPTWTRELIEKVGDKKGSVESSIAIFGDRLYASNGLGRILGLDISEIREGRAPIVLDFWAGDDVDASIVVDEQGMLYVAAELERELPRAAEVGQLFKLDPSRPDDPLVWGIPIPRAEGDDRGGGIWATPALGDGVLYVTSQSGHLRAVDRETGEVLYIEEIRKHMWSSPVVVGDELLVTGCGGELRAYDISEPGQPKLNWTLPVAKRKCIESTPVVYNRRIYVGAWDGHFYAVGNAPVVTAESEGLREDSGARP